MASCSVCHGRGWISNGTNRFACPAPGCPFSRTPPFRAAHAAAPLAPPPTRPVTRPVTRPFTLPVTFAPRRW